MTNENAINELKDIKKQFVFSVQEAKLGDVYAVDALETNTNMINAIDMAIAALERQGKVPCNPCDNCDCMFGSERCNEIRRKLEG